MPRICSLMLIFSVLVVGCAKPPEPAPIPAALSASDAAVLKQSIEQSSPNARVGIVSAVLAEENLAMVAQINIQGLRVNDVMTIVDSQENAILHGHVRQIMDDRVAVEFDAGGRAPMVGDVVVKY